jgi:hypothetical protein
MTSFAAILDGLDETPDRGEGPDRTATLLWTAGAFASGDCASRDPHAFIDVRAQEARAEYDRSAPDMREGENSTKSVEKIQKILLELESSEPSIGELQAARRKLAWLCHPDRAAAMTGTRPNVSMSHVNARIDRAIMKNLDAARRRSSAR